MAKARVETALWTYRRKRDLSKTAEPSGTAAQRAPRRAVRGRATAGKRRTRKATGPIFVVQKHAASHLHYDFRLEVNGVLKSWAVPKGPSLDPTVRRLAVEVEDHPFDYRDFEGTIPKGQYGGGTVIVWDTGTYLNLKTGKDGRPWPMDQALEKGTVEIWLEGQKLRGGFALIRTGMGGRKNQWLLVKLKDEGADPRMDITATEPASVLTGRTIEQVAAQESGAGDGAGDGPRTRRRVRQSS